jgi:hypothetical protein
MKTVLNPGFYMQIQNFQEKRRRRERNYLQTNVSVSLLKKRKKVVQTLQVRNIN